MAALKIKNVAIYDRNLYLWSHLNENFQMSLSLVISEEFITFGSEEHTMVSKRAHHGFQSFHCWDKTLTYATTSCIRN